MNLAKYKKTIISIRMIFRLRFLVFVILLFFICDNKSRAQELKRELNNDRIRKIGLKEMSTPSILAKSQERFNHIVSHYWDGFNFSDISRMEERTFANFINLMFHADKPSIEIAISDMLSRAEAESSKLYRYFLEMYEKYLYDPNSPFGNEEYYIPVLKHVIESPGTDEVELVKVQYLLSLLLINRVGHQAANITYILDSSHSGTLWGINSEYTLLLFYNPDCNACEQLIHYLKNSHIINAMLNKELLKILAIYPDKDLIVWEKYKKDIPEKWINGYDNNMEIHDKQLYNLKAIPMLYLLDKDKNILLKDVELHHLEQYLKSTNS